MKWMLLGCSAVFSLTSLSMALGAVPSRVTDDTAIYQNLSEIQVARQGALNFDGDIAQLSSMEGRYRENLPAVSRAARVKAPSERIAKQQYRFVGTRPTVTKK